MDEQIYAIRTQEDIETFLKESNGLHDGYVTSVHYDNEKVYVRLEDGWSFISPYDGEIRIRVMVTSMCDTVIELIFKGVSDWQMKQRSYDIFGSSLAILEDGQVVWTDMPGTDKETREQRSFVIARSMEYRFLEDHRPGKEL